jgi:hypothetical protein
MVPGTGHQTGLPLTDIAFIGDQMYGTTSNALYQIDDTTGPSTLVGDYSFSHAVNALVGHDGNLYAASNNSHDIYQISPSTGPELYAHIGYASAGDLAWSNNVLYESVREGNGRDGLYNVTDHRLVGTFHTASGATFNNVFALTDNQPALGRPPHGMFAVAGHDIYQIDLATARLTHLSNNAATGIGAASGAAWQNE